VPKLPLRRETVSFRERDRGFESGSLQRQSVANLTRDGRVFAI